MKIRETVDHVHADGSVVTTDEDGVLRLHGPSCPIAQAARGPAKVTSKAYRAGGDASIAAARQRVRP